jgi:hypothetical protein
MESHITTFSQLPECSKVKQPPKEAYNDDYINFERIIQLHRLFRSILSGLDVVVSFRSGVVIRRISRLCPVLARPGIVDTAIHDWIRSQPAERIGEGLRNQFIGFREAGLLISPEHSAAALIARLGDDTTGQIWDVDDEKPRH